MSAVQLIGTRPGALPGGVVSGAVPGDRTERVRAVAALRRTQRYAPFRRMISARGALVLRRAGLAVALLLIGTTATVLGRWLAAHTTPATVTAGVLLAAVAGSAAIALRALSGTSRTQVSAPSDLGLLRALDLRPPEVFAELVARPLVGRQLALLGAVLLFQIGAGAPVPVTAAVVCVPVGLGLLTLGVAVARCAAPVVTRSGLLSLVVGTAVAAGSGWVVGRGLDQVVHHGSLEVRPDLQAPLTAMAVAVALSAGLAGIGIARRGRRGLDRLSWGSPDRARARSKASAAGEYARMQAMVDRSPLAGSVLGVWRTIILIAAFGGGMVAAGADLPPALAAVVGPLLTGYAFVTVLVASGVVFSVVGPSAMIDRSRFLWEASDLSAGVVAARSLAYPLAVVVVPCALLSLAQSLLVGQVSVRTLALGVTLVGAAVLAESILPVSHHTNGTITHHPLTAWVVLLVSMPAAAVPIGIVGSVLSTGYALSCLGAGHRCLTRRILRLPSSSVT